VMFSEWEFKQITLIPRKEDEDESFVGSRYILPRYGRWIMVDISIWGC